jgi:serine/threonine protein kinase
MEHIKTKKKLAGKRTTPTIEEREMYESEVKIGMRLKNIFVARVVDAFMSESDFWVMMEYWEGGTMRNFIEELKKRRKKIEEAVFFFFISFFF